jgi:polyisoprenoid-binding protein YceI
VHGTFTLREGDIHVADPVSESSARARISAASFWTGNTSRDRTVRSAGLLDAAAHPDITFTSNRLDHAGGRWIMHGLLSVRGTARPVEVLVEETQSRGPELRLRASVRLDRYDFEITRYRGLAVRRLDCRLDVVAHRL